MSTLWALVACIVAVALPAALLAFLLLQRRALCAALRRRKDELAHAARLAATGELIASIAHEINQPLGAILSNADAAELLLAQPQVPLVELRHILADIRADDLRAHAVIRRLRALLERRETERHPVDVHAALADTVKLVAGEAGRRRVRIELAAGASRATVHADPVQVQQILLNLLLNAMDAMSATPIERRTVSIATRDGAGCIEVTVSDRGHGFGRQDAERLFDSFFTTKPHGMGLGLSIARSIVQAHDGSIAAAPRPGGGAVFTVHLPTDPHMKPVPARPGRRSPQTPRSAAVA